MIEGATMLTGAEGALGPGPDSGARGAGGGVVGLDGVATGVVGLGALGCVGVGVSFGLTASARIRFSAVANAFLAARRHTAGFFDFRQRRIAALYALLAAASALRAADGVSRRGAATWEL